MKTPKLERGSDGGYPGSIATQLTREERSAIRRALVEAREPLFLTGIAAKAGLDITSPYRQQNISQFVDFLCETSRECEMRFETNKRGVDVFRGFSITEHGKDLFSKGLS